VFAWIGQTATGALQRQLFSAHDVGKAWHAMDKVRTLDPGEGLIGLRVDPETPTSCSVIFWPPARTLWTQSSIKQTAPTTRIMATVNEGSGLSRVMIKIWDAEGNASSPEFQWSLDGTNWSYASVLKLDGLSYSYAMSVAAVPTGSLHEVIWNSGADLAPGYVGNILLRARSRDITLVGAWSDPVLYHVEVSDDSNHDGVPDAWAMAHNLDPLATNGVQYATGDADGDGVDNLTEYWADTDPQNSDSHLRVTGIDILPSGIRVDWKGGVWARQYLEVRQTLGGTSEQWTAVFTNLPPTATATNIIDAGATNRVLFYRIKAER